MQKDIHEKFWEQVAEDLADANGGHHPKDWKESDIRSFNVDFQIRLVDIFKKDRTKARICGQAWNDKNYDDFNAPDNTTFRRIFQKKTSKSNVGKRNQFAVYLGYNSFEDYVLKHQIKSDAPARAKKNASDLINGPESVSTSILESKYSRRAVGVFLLVVFCMLLLVGMR